MTIRALADLGNDDNGKAPLKLAFASCLVALAFAASSPAFEANPLLGKTVHEMRRHLPQTLETVTHAMGGQ